MNSAPRVPVSYEDAVKAGELDGSPGVISIDHFLDDDEETSEEKLLNESDLFLY